ncbi:amidase [Spongiactinospora sp. TRM90649]|uniref:amidase n=1 Tax=Spongiactinospora sp. TRM90649 TaxID=3031114 RepID=UPI0023F80439|nr:amidase [Spongiactinospora sp. TRM90649]MDF5755122.1 amidase [Spongiactinospora sp. TRM90649]
MDLFASAVRLARAIRARDLGPAELAAAYLERIDRFDPEINAIVWRDDEQILDAARAAERALTSGAPIGPFHGVPLPVKDLTSVAGQPNTMGSRGVSSAPRPVNDLVVDRLLAAGFILMGRSNTPEMGTLPATENARYGATANPWDLTRSPAGSSGGAAAAVAAGMAPIAHGNDGGGSLRMPASACGLVGLKPSRARIPQHVQSWWEYCTTEGVITRYVEDAATVLDALSAPDPHAWFQAPAPARPFAEETGRLADRLRVGLLLEAPTGLPVHAECVKAALAAARLLEGLGHDVFPVQPFLLSPQGAHAYVEMVIPTSLYVHPFDDPELAEPYNRHRWQRVRDIDAGSYAQAVALLQTESRLVAAQWRRDFDVLLTPTMAAPPPPLGTVRDDANRHPETAMPSALAMVSFTAVASVTGLPAISLPVHTSADGLPIGAQLIGAPFDEATLIRLASAMESLTGWPDARPSRYTT